MTKAEILQTAKPILFNTQMVKAILDGRKITIRRLMDQDNVNFILRSHAREMSGMTDGTFLTTLFATPKKAGDILYVRETWAKKDGVYLYRADDETPEGWHTTAWRPSIHMPKVAARIFLRVTGVCAERLQEMDAWDAQEEGIENEICVKCLSENWDRRCTPWAFEENPCGNEEQVIEQFAKLWDSTVPKDKLNTCGWDANPWVWRINFERLTVDEIADKGEVF